MCIKYFRLFFTVLFISLGLVACGEGDSGAKDTAKSTAPAPSTPAPAPKSAPAPVESAAMKVMEDNGVIYQEEIYKNWPYN